MPFRRETIILSIVLSAAGYAGALIGKSDDPDPVPLGARAPIQDEVRQAQDLLGAISRLEGGPPPDFGGLEDLPDPLDQIDKLTPFR